MSRRNGLIAAADIAHAEARWQTEMTARSRGSRAREHAYAAERAMVIRSAIGVQAELDAQQPEGASAWSHTGGSSVGEGRPDHCIECSEAAGEWVAWPCSPEALVKAAVEIDRFHRSAEFDSEVEHELARRIASMHGRQFVCTRGHMHIAGTATEDHVCRLDETGGED